jgi:prepilin-type N-terminal cleavage/methylation domain-containing protein
MRPDRKMIKKNAEISLLKHSGGYTLLEVLLAVTIIAIGVLGAAGLAGTAYRSSFHSLGVPSTASP